MNEFYEELNATHYGGTPEQKENVNVLFRSHRNLKQQIAMRSDVLVDETTGEKFRVMVKTINVIEPL